MPTLTDAEVAAFLVERYGSKALCDLLPGAVLRRHAWRIHSLIAAMEDNDDVAAAWMTSRNTHLGDWEPIVAIAVGRICDVEAAVAAHRDGVGT